MTEDLLAEYCKKESFIGAFRASAKDNFGIEEGFRFLAEHVSLLRTFADLSLKIC